MTMKFIWQIAFKGGVYKYLFSKFFQGRFVHLATPQLTIFSQKNICLQFFKGSGLEISQIIKDHYKLVETTQAQARPIIFQRVTQNFIFDRVFHFRKIFDRIEILKEKLQESEQKKANKQTNKMQKRLSNHLFEINCI